MNTPESLNPSTSVSGRRIWHTSFHTSRPAALIGARVCASGGIVMARHRSRKVRELSPLLQRLIEAAKRSGVDSEGTDISGVPEVLREFGALARWAIPIHGVFLPNNEALVRLAERMARECLDKDQARRELSEALYAVADFHQRDAIETAVNHMLSVSDEAYFYAGIAFGLTMAERHE
jgi:hypothetical protein